MVDPLPGFVSILERMMRRSAIGTALAVGCLASAALPRAGEAAGSLRVAAAANLKPALDEIAAAFQASQPGVEVKVTYGASGILHAQIASGAPYGLFLSADAVHPAKLAAAGLADPEGPFTYAMGGLVVWVPRGSGLDLAGAGLRALLHPSVRKVAIANPATAPYGAAAVAAMKASGVHAGLSGRLVLGESVSQTAQFAESGGAQAAFLPRSLAMGPPLDREGTVFEVPPETYPPIEQAGVVLKGARDAPLARAFAAWLRGPPGRAILARHGYGLPGR